MVARPFILSPLGKTIAASVAWDGVEFTVEDALADGPPVFTVNPSISGTTTIGETLTGTDGTVTGGTVTARAWLRDGVAISGATGTTYVLAEADEDATITFRNTAIGPGGSVNATSAGVGPVVAGFDPAAYPLSTAKYDGDSRTAGAGGRTVSAGSLILGHGLGGVGSTSLLQAICGNKWMLREGYQHAVGSTTTLCQEERSGTTSIANTGNPAQAITGIPSDANYSVNSDSLSTILTQDGKHVFSASVGVNDNGAGAYYNTPSTAWETLRTIANIADAIGAAGKVWYVGNEFPRGDVYYVMESKTVTAGACTATNANNFVDGESFGAVGAVGIFASGVPRILTKVSSSPGQDEYTVTSGGVYAFGGTAPTRAFISYNASPNAGRTATYDQLRIVREFCNSSAANFVSATNSVDYGIPGLQYNRPWVRVVDTFGALVDPASGATQLPYPGTSDVLQLHGLALNQYKSAQVFKAKVDADYPDAPDLSTAPTRNNWLTARQTTGTFIYNFTLPPSMRTGFTGTPAPTLIAVAGVPIGTVNTSTGAITGTNITSGSLDFATGVGTITFSSVTNAAEIWFEQDFGNGTINLSGGAFSSFTEGTIGRNTVNNGLLDMAAAVGTGLLSTTGTSTVTGIASSEIPYGWNFTSTALNNAIAAGTAVVDVSSGADEDGYPMFFVDIEAYWTGANIQPQLGTPALSNFGARVTAGDKLLVAATVRYAPHPTLGLTYGNNGARVTGSFGTASANVPSPTGTQAITQVNIRAANDFGLFVDQPVITAAGDSLELHRLSALKETTGLTFSAPVVSLAFGGVAQNTPAAYRVGMSRVQERRRNDVS
jgi:hypothetical protein